MKSETELPQNTETWLCAIFSKRSHSLSRVVLRWETKRKGKMPFSFVHLLCKEYVPKIFYLLVFIAPKVRVCVNLDACPLKS